MFKSIIIIALLLPVMGYGQRRQKLEKRLAEAEQQIGVLHDQLMSMSQAFMFKTLGELALAQEQEELHKRVDSLITECHLIDFKADEAYRQIPGNILWNRSWTIFDTLYSQPLEMRRNPPFIQKLIPLSPTGYDTTGAYQLGRIICRPK